MGPLFDCVFNSFRADIGDPHVMGWVTVACYFLTAVIAFFVSLRVNNISTDSERKKNRLFWLCMAFALIVLGVNKQLDLQTYLTAVGRCASKLGGWYEERQHVQFLFVISIGIFISVAVLFVLWAFRKSFSHNIVAIIGLIILLTFILLRVASFHHVDMYILHRTHGIRVQWILELSGLLLICIQGIINLRKAKKVNLEGEVVILPPLN